MAFFKTLLCMEQGLLLLRKVRKTIPQKKIPQTDDMGDTPGVTPCGILEIDSGQLCLGNSHCWMLLRLRSSPARLSGPRLLNNASAQKLRVAGATWDAQLGQRRKLHKVGNRPGAWRDYRCGKPIITSAAKPWTVTNLKQFVGSLGRFCCPSA